MSDLTPCPFCGSKNLVTRTMGSSEGWQSFVWCGDCKSRGPISGPHTEHIDEAETASRIRWNSRIAGIEKWLSHRAHNSEIVRFEP